MRQAKQDQVAVIAKHGHAARAHGPCRPLSVRAGHGLERDMNVSRSPLAGLSNMAQIRSVDVPRGTSNSRRRHAQQVSPTEAEGGHPALQPSLHGYRHSVPHTQQRDRHAQLGGVSAIPAAMASDGRSSPGFDGPETRLGGPGGAGTTPSATPLTPITSGVPSPSQLPVKGSDGVLEGLQTTKWRKLFRSPAAEHSFRWRMFQQLWLTNFIVVATTLAIGTYLLIQTDVSTNVPGHEGSRLLVSLLLFIPAVLLAATSLTFLWAARAHMPYIQHCLQDAQVTAAQQGDSMLRGRATVGSSDRSFELHRSAVPAIDTVEATVVDGPAAGIGTQVATQPAGQATSETQVQGLARDRAGSGLLARSRRSRSVGQVPVQQTRHNAPRQAVPEAPALDAVPINILPFMGTAWDTKTMQPSLIDPLDAMRSGRCGMGRHRMAETVVWWTSHYWDWHLALTLASAAVAFNGSFISVCVNETGAAEVCAGYALGRFPLSPALVVLAACTVLPVVVNNFAAGLTALVMMYTVLIVQMALLYPNINAVPGTVDRVWDTVLVTLLLACAAAGSCMAVYLLSQYRRRSYGLNVSLQLRFLEYKSALNAWREAQLSMQKSRVETIKAKASQIASEVTIGYTAHSLRNPLHMLRSIVDEQAQRDAERMARPQSRMAVAPAGGTAAAAAAPRPAAGSLVAPPISPAETRTTDAQDTADWDDMKQAIAHMIRVTENALEHQQLLSSRVILRMERVELRSVIVRVTEVLARRYSKAISVSIAESVPHHVIMDAVRVEQMFANGLANALEAAPHVPVGGWIAVLVYLVRAPPPRMRSDRSLISVVQKPGRLLEDPEPAEASGRSRGPLPVYLHIEVVNRGPGLGGQSPTSLFTPFDVRSTSEEEGLSPGRVQSIGLGLSIVRLLAELMHGRVGLYDEAGPLAGETPASPGPALEPGPAGVPTAAPPAGTLTTAVTVPTAGVSLASAPDAEASGTPQTPASAVTRFFIELPLTQQPVAWGVPGPAMLSTGQLFPVLSIQDMPTTPVVGQVPTGTMGPAGHRQVTHMPRVRTGLTPLAAAEIAATPVTPLSTAPVEAPVQIAVHVAQPEVSQVTPSAVRPAALLPEGRERGTAQLVGEGYVLPEGAHLPAALHRPGCSRTWIVYPAIRPHEHQPRPFGQLTSYQRGTTAVGGYTRPEEGTAGMPATGALSTASLAGGGVEPSPLPFTGLPPRPGPAPGPQSVTDAAGRAPPEFLGLRVLTVDDETSNRKVNKRMLDRLGCDTVTADDGDTALEAVRKARAEGRPFDAILLDIVMRRLHGDVACSIMRSEGYAGPIVAATGNATAADRERYLASGFDDVIGKPFTAEDIAECFRALGVRPGSAVWARPVSLEPGQLEQAAHMESGLAMGKSDPATGRRAVDSWPGTAGRTTASQPAGQSSSATEPPSAPGTARKTDLR